MRLEDYFEFLDPNDIRIKGHRIGIESILDEYLFRAQTAEEIAQRFPTLTLEQVYATILYYLQNKEKVDNYMTDWLDYCQRSRKENLEKHAAWYEKMRRLKAERQSQQPKALS